MENFLKTLGEKLCAQRQEAPASNNYTALLDAVFFSKEFDGSLNDNAELAEAVTKALSTLRAVERYCMEELYLHGKPFEQLVDEFRGCMDIEKYVEIMIEKVPEMIEESLKDSIGVIFYKIQKDSFSVLKAQNGSSKANEDSWSDPNQSVLDVLKSDIENLDSYGFGYKEFFEKYFIEGQSKEALAEWILENMDEYVRENHVYFALRKLRHPVRSRQFKKFVTD